MQQHASNEALVIAASDDAGDLSRRLAPDLIVRHAVSPRVFVVNGPPAALTRLAATSGHGTATMPKTRVGDDEETGAGFGEMVHAG